MSMRAGRRRDRVALGGASGRPRARDGAARARRESRCASTTTASRRSRQRPSRRIAQIIGALLEAGADVESPNAEGQTALMVVARTGRVDAARLLLEHGARVNARETFGGQTALMWAAAQKHPDMIRLLRRERRRRSTRAAPRTTGSGA